MSQLTTLKWAKAVLKSIILTNIIPKTPSSISKNFRHLDETKIDLVAQSLKKHYFSQPDHRYGATLEEYLTSEKGKNDFQNHLIRRMDIDRRTVIPWLQHVKSLCGANVLEIGCGTGCSTIALAEQGAKVTAVDVNCNSIEVAKDRCEIYDLDAHFICANACELYSILANKRYDFIIFFAALEHMTHEERLVAMKKTWEMLPEGGLWVVIETPNRLWFYDGHTSHLPFFSWLPDNLAFAYSQFSPREGFNTAFQNINEESMHEFLRLGRGVSFHEFDLTLKKVEELKVISSLELFLRKKNVLWKVMRRMSANHKYESVLRKVGPRIHKGFYQPNLNLIIEKN